MEQDLEVFKVVADSPHQQKDLKDIKEPQVVLVLELEDRKEHRVLVQQEVLVVQYSLWMAHVLFKTV